MMTASLGIAVFALGPAQFEALAQSAIAATLFSSNVWFWNTTSGYFGADVDLEPLLHTWSLGVEEQFYIVFPLLLALIFRFARGHVVTAMLAISAVSLAVSSFQLFGGLQQAAFYLLHSRAWELGAGALIALARLPAPGGGRLRHAVAGLGAAGILVPILCYGETTPFPGPAALAPVLGTAVLLWVNERGENSVKTLLVTAPFVLLGLASYSIYLWHWPTIVFAKVLFGDLTPGRSLACILLSCALGVLSWRYIEQPFRRRDGVLRTRRVVFGASGSAMLAVVALSAVVWIGGGFPGRLPGDTAAVFAAADDVDPRSTRCMGRQAIGIAECRIGAAAVGVQADFLLWGDSHAAAALPGVARAAEIAGRSGFAVAFPACAPLLDTVRLDIARRSACPKFNAEVLLSRRADDIPVVLLVARWALAAEGTPPPRKNWLPRSLPTPARRCGPARSKTTIRSSRNA